MKGTYLRVLLLLPVTAVTAIVLLMSVATVPTMTMPVVSMPTVTHVSRRLVLAPRTLDRSAMNELVLKLHNGQRGILVRVKLDESESSVGLHADLDNVAVALEQRDEVGLSSVRDEVANVYGRIVLGRLRDDLFVRHACRAGSTAGTAIAGPTTHTAAASTAPVCARRGVVAPGPTAARLRLLISPVDTDRTRSEPFAVHCRDGLLGVRLVTAS